MAKKESDFWFCVFRTGQWSLASTYWLCMVRWPFLVPISCVDRIERKSEYPDSHHCGASLTMLRRFPSKCGHSSIFLLNNMENMKENLLYPKHLNRQKPSNKGGIWFITFLLTLKVYMWIYFKVLPIKVKSFASKSADGYAFSFSILFLFQFT